MTGIIFVRHGATEGNLQKRYIGRTDEPLSSKGRLQIQNLRKENIEADRLFVSPKLRAVQTADILFPGMAYQIIDDFREIDFGIFEGKTAEELSACEEYQKWVDSFCLAPIPSGESLSDFKNRCIKAFTVAVNQTSDLTKVAVVVHGGVIMAIMEAFAYPPMDFYDSYIGNGEFILCRYEKGILYPERGNPSRIGKNI